MFTRIKFTKVISLLIVASFTQSLLAEETFKRNRFNQLYNQHANSSYTLNTPPGQQFSAPVTFSHTVKPHAMGLNFVMGTFSSHPAQGSRVILKSVPYNGDGIDQLFSRQFFSGYRWFWHEVDGRVVSSIQGGFYDVSSITLPTNASYTFNNNVFQLTWVAPTTPDYGTKLVFKESHERETMESSKGILVFEGNGTSATYSHAPKPGSILHFGFFGSYPIGGVRIDSGSGVQYWPNQSGAYQAISGVHQYSDLTKLRLLLVISVPLIERFSKNLYKIKPDLAPEPTDPEGNIIGWPITDTYLTIHGKNWWVEDCPEKDCSMENCQIKECIMEDYHLKENGIAVDESRIIDWGSDYIHLSLPGNLLDPTQPCRDLTYSVESKNNVGLASNMVKTRLVNANYNYATLCDR